MSERSETPLTEERYMLMGPAAILKRNRVLERRIAAALDELEGYEDVEDRPNGEGVRPNLAMRVAMILRGEDQP